jgi:mRNA-degrading endonuclease YafQ of YafQ-DinJ toxin-antitoxin module
MYFYFRSQFKKKLQKISPSIKEKFFDRLELFLRDQNNIILGNHSVEKAYPNCRSINITGDYRAIFYIEDNIAIFINIGTHADLYR